MTKTRTKFELGIKNVETAETLEPGTIFQAYGSDHGRLCIRLSDGNYAWLGTGNVFASATVGPPKVAKRVTITVEEWE